MKRIISITIVIFYLCLIPAQAQDTQPWTVWLFDNSQGRTVQVDALGNVLNDVILPIPADFDSFRIENNVAVSPDGTRLAYSVDGMNAEEQRISALVVYDTILNRTLFNYETPEYAIVSSLTFSHVAWNSTGNIVAFAYASGDTLETQAWNIVVLNAVDGRVLSELDSNGAYFSAQADLQAPYLLPVLQYFGEATLSFNLIPYQTASLSADFQSYDWDIVTGRTLQNNRAPRILTDTLANTGETVSPIIDERATYDAEKAPYTNSLHVYRPEVEARAPFFATSTYDLLSAQFVQNGEQVIALAEDLLSFDQTFLLVNRIGVLRRLPTINAINNAIIGTPDGYVYVVDNPTPFLLSVDTRDESFPQTPIWGAPENSRFVPIWATLRPQEDYSAWLQLAPLLFPTQVIINNANSSGIAPDEVPTPIVSGVSTGFITVDSVAVINTTSGDRLNMRDNAGLNSTVIARLDSGTRVVVTDGSVNADGFTWWQVRLSTGQVGWVVERAEGVQTLVPER